MVVRIKKTSRKHLGQRRWGKGNIKNARGSGDRGGTGKSGAKHKWTYIVKYAKEQIRRKGFFNKNATEKLETIDIAMISDMARKSKDAKPTIELSGYKVLSDGMLSKAVTVKASNFSKQAQEKIKKAGGEAVKI
ncbi:MAG: uL15 family ribosomal protein [Candidatus Micrarchaeota archaeon]|nr:uL15 family ribosomal protein [Candidatus Micrarchaeota archaeon]